MGTRPNRAGTAGAALADVLVECRAELAGEPDDPRLALIDELLSRLPARAESDDVADLLAGFAGRDATRRETLLGVVSLVARNLADGDDPPSPPAEAALWRSLVVLADRFYGSGVEPLGRLPFIGDRLVELLVAESRVAERREDRAGEAGDVLAQVAVSRKLCGVVEAAVGFPVAPTYRAVYLYDPPGSHVATHVDSQDYEVIFHLVLEHTVPAGAAGSALVAHLVGHPSPTRVRLAPGEALALRGRGTIHSWEPMAAAERRTLIGVGFQRAE